MVLRARDGFLYEGVEALVLHDFFRCLAVIILEKCELIAGNEILELSPGRGGPCAESGWAVESAEEAGAAVALEPRLDRKRAPEREYRPA